MAKKEDRKKQKKQKKQHKKAKKRAARDEFPRTEIVFDGEDQEFMVAVEEVIQTFDYANEEHCPQAVREMHRMLRKAGVGIIKKGFYSEKLDSVADQHGFDADAVREVEQWALHGHLPDWIFKNLPERYTKDPLPQYFFRVSPKGRGFEVSFKFLPQIEVGTQRVWCSPFEPTVNIRGKDYKVCFTKHVFEQACKRMLLEQPPEYFRLLGLVEYFRRCVYFEHVLLEDGQDALRLFGPCVYELGDMYLHEIAQLKNPDPQGGEWCFVVGYCPIALSDSGHAITITLLFPGYKNTPEAALVNRTRMNATLRSELQKAAQDNTLGRVCMERNLKPLRWYHHNGVPQVIRLDTPLLRPQ